MSNPVKGSRQSPSLARVSTRGGRPTRAAHRPARDMWRLRASCSIAYARGSSGLTRASRRSKRALEPGRAAAAAGDGLRLGAEVFVLLAGRPSGGSGGLTPAGPPEAALGAGAARSSAAAAAGLDQRRRPPALCWRRPRAGGRRRCWRSQPMRSTICPRDSTPTTSSRLVSRGRATTAAGCPVRRALSGEASASAIRR
jgi:hypothetical protein